MSALHRAWLADQADALEYRRCMAELDAYANPSEPVRSAAQELRAALREQRETRQQPRDKQVRPKRYQTLAECMGDSLDYTDGPASIELHQLLLNAAAGADVQAQANELLGRMAVVFAKFNAEAA